MQAALVIPSRTDSSEDTEFDLIGPPANVAVQEDAAGRSSTSNENDLDIDEAVDVDVDSPESPRRPMTPPARPRKTVSLQTALHDETIKRHLAPYAAPISSALDAHFQLMSPDHLLANFAEYENVARWCVLASCEPALKMTSTKLLRKKTSKSSASRAPAGGPITHSSDDYHPTVGRRAYKTLIHRVLRLAISRGDGQVASTILDSIESVWADAVWQLELLTGYGFECRVKMSSPTRSNLATTYRSRIKVFMMELMTLWFCVSKSFGQDGQMLRTAFPETVFTLALVPVTERYPDTSELWKLATHNFKMHNAPANTSHHPSLVDSRRSVAKLVQTFAIQSYIAHPFILQSVIKRVLAQGKYTVPLQMWPHIQEYLSARDPASYSEPDKLVLTTFLAAIIQAKSVRPSSIQSHEAFSEIVRLIPRPTPTYVYHTLLRVYSIPKAAGFRVDPHNPRRSVTQDAYQMFKITWDTMKEEGSRDMYSYQLAVHGAGGYGDVEMVKQCWEDLQADEHCKRAWKEKGESTVH